VARHIILAHPLLNLDDSRLRCRRESVHRQLRVMSHAQQGSVVLERDGGQPPLQILAAPIEVGAKPRRGRPYTALYLFCGTHYCRQAISLLGDLYGLSRAEARVAVALLRHPDLRGVARALYISPSTVRTHLRNIYYKTDTNSQSTLIHCLATGPVVNLLHLDASP